MIPEIGARNNSETRNIINMLVNHANGIQSLNSVNINRGQEYPLKSLKIEGMEPKPIHENAKNAILDAKVFGAKIGHYYRLSFVSNGFVSKGEPRYGVTISEYTASDGVLTRHVAVYNDDVKPENNSNFNYQPTSTTIDTIIIDTGEFVFSITVDRGYIDSKGSPDFANFNSGYYKSETAVIDPVNYFF